MDVDLEGGEGAFGVVGIGHGEGGGGHFGGVFFVVFAVGVTAFFVDGFEVAGVVAVDDEVEFVCCVSAGDGGGAFDFPGCGVAVPGVDVVHCVVCHEEEVAGAGGEDGDALRFVEDGAAGDAAFGGGDVVCKDGEVFGGVAVEFVVVEVFVDAAFSAGAVNDGVVGEDGGLLSGAVVAAAGDPCVLCGDGGFVAGGDDPLGVFCAE